MPPNNPVRLMPDVYLGGTTVVVTGSSQAVAIPNGADSAELRAEDGPAYFAVNAPAASPTSPGYCPGDGPPGFVYAIKNFNSLHVYLDAAATALHIHFYKSS